MKKNKLIKTSLLVGLMVSFFACTEKEESIPEQNESSSWTITVGAFNLNNGVYTALGNEFIFDSEEGCQIWSRTAQGDSHDTDSHLHYNAATNVVYDPNTINFSWVEYGPEIDQASIENTCSNAVNGVEKTVNDTGYYQDKPNVYLKITSVIEN